jgi:hypothetical protein
MLRIDDILQSFHSFFFQLPKHNLELEEVLNMAEIVG